MTVELRGKHIAITGAARGIGLATARALVERGARVTIGDLDGELAAKAAIDLGDVVGLQVDVADKRSFEAFLDRAEVATGELDVLVNNAGIMPLGRLIDEPDELTHRIVDVNLHGAIHGSKLAASRMLPRGRGHIVSISSGVGRVPLAGAATYSATKFAVVGLSEALRSELRGTGVDVSVVLPLIVSTELGSGLRTVRGQRTVTPEEVAAAVVRVIEQPRFETWVPASGYRLYRAMSVLPQSWRDAVSRWIGAADLLATADESARRDYENRVRG